MFDSDDFYTYLLITQNNDNENHGDGGNGGDGCGCLPWLVIALAVVWLIGKLS